MPRKSTLKFLILAAGLILLWLLGRYFHIDPDKTESFFSRFPLIYSGIIFICLYVVITFFFWLSKDIFKLVSAFIFGAYVSALLILIAEAINAAVLFSLSRFLGRQFVKDHLGNISAGLDKKISSSGFLGLFLLRSVPLVPFRFLDLAAGLADVSFKRYMAVVCLGSPVRIFWVQYIISGAGKGILKDPQELVNYLGTNKAALIFSFIYLVLVIFVAIKMRKSKHAGKN
ncbi:MAG: VTT domain-containing protein [Candidatus Omnitrophota bacterium]